MFNLGMVEMLVLGALALMVLGPKQLPELARSVARLLNELRRVKNDLTSSLSEVERETQEAIQDTLNKAQTKIETPFKEIKEITHKVQEKPGQRHEEIEE